MNCTRRIYCWSGETAYFNTSHHVYNESYCVTNQESILKLKIVEMFTVIYIKDIDVLFIFYFWCYFMAWHSKRHNIKHRKAAQDAKKSKVYAKVAKLIQMAARDGDDRSMNPKLDLALTKAKSAGLPKDVIQRAIDKWAWNLEWEELQEIFYEWYGPGGVAMYIKCVTDNTNRSWSSVKSILTKYGSSLWSPWSVARQFTEKWELYVTWKKHTKVIKGKEIEEVLPLDKEEIELAIMETVAENYEFDDEAVRVITSRDDFSSTVTQLEGEWRNVEDASLQFLAENELALSESDEQKLEKLLDALEDDDDVDEIWHNAK